MNTENYDIVCTLMEEYKESKLSITRSNFTGSRKILGNLSDFNIKQQLEKQEWIRGEIDRLVNEGDVNVGQ